jgi:putative sterol carrier protein
MNGLFTDDWAAAWGDALNRSAAYQAAGKAWEGALVLEAQADPERGLAESAAVWLDLWRGTCRAARLATTDDLDRARFVITGPLAVWLAILAGELAPTMAILQGRLTLARGSMLGLMPHVQAATELLRVAQELNGGRDVR